MGDSPLKKKKDYDEIAKWIVVAQNGDEKAFGEIVRLSQDRLFRFCVYLTGNRPLAQDICQDTLISMLRNISSIKDPKSFMGWLFTMARNLYIDHLRSPRNAAHLPLDQVSPATQVVTEDHAFTLEVQKTLNQLDPDDKAIILLIDLEEHSYSEAAEVMNVTESAIRSRIHRARAAFAKLYQK